MANKKIHEPQVFINKEVLLILHKRGLTREPKGVVFFSFFLRKGFKITRAISLFLYENVTSLDQEEKDILDHNIVEQRSLVLLLLIGNFSLMQKKSIMSIK